jgi:VanZ family protein
LFLRSLNGVLAVLILLAFLVVGLFPFRWTPPRQVANGAVQRDDGTLAFVTPGIAYASEASEWIDESIQRNAFELKLRVRTSQTTQHGPARILTVSRSPLMRNLTIGQSGTDLVVRLRTPATSPNGMPDHTIQSVFTDKDWREILVAVRSETLHVCVDGVERLKHSLPSRPLSSWDGSYLLALGNELTRNRPWLGGISTVKVQAGEREWNYLDSAAIEAPRWHWNGLKLQLYTPRHSFALDALLNFACFVPFGFCMAIALRRWCLAPLVCAAISFGVEFLQLFFDTRMPSVSDWISNSCGAAVGACCAYLAYRHYRTARQRKAQVESVTFSPSGDRTEAAWECQPCLMSKKL